MTTNRALLAGAFLLLGLAARGDEGVVPGGAYDASRYQTLWETSPFAVATPVAVESSEYSLVGAAQFDGVSYASVVDKNSQEHFVVTSKTPAHGLTLLTLVRGRDVASTSATFQKDGAVLSLQLETNNAGSPPPELANAPPTAVPSPAPVLYSPVFHRHPPRAHIFVPPTFVPRPPPNSP